MGRAVGLITLLVVSLMLFSFLGLYSENTTTTTGLIMKLIINPSSLDFDLSNIGNSDIFDGIDELIAAFSLGGGAVLLGFGLVTKSEVAVRAAFAFVLLGILQEFVILFNAISKYSGDIVATLTVGLLAIIFLFIVMEWVSGRD